jgi:hypothetical protein
MAGSLASLAPHRNLKPRTSPGKRGRAARPCPGAIDRKPARRHEDTHAGDHGPAGIIFLAQLVEVLAGLASLPRTTPIGCSSSELDEDQEF